MFIINRLEGILKQVYLQRIANIMLFIKLLNLNCLTTAAPHGLDRSG